ncbi:MAG: ankyrin repeat domain-containing protein [Bryobacteraceae bacterium]
MFLTFLSMAFLASPPATGHLHQLAAGCDAELVRRAIAAGEAINDLDAEGNTPLILAVATAHPVCVYLLLQAGANKYTMNRRGRAPETIARLSPPGLGHDEMVALLTNPSLFQDKDATPEHFLEQAMSRGIAPLAALLLEMGVDANTRDEQGNTLLHNAALKGHHGIVLLLLQHGASISASSDAGTLPIHDAAVGGNGSVVKELLRRGADPQSTTKNTRETPLHLAACWGRTEVVRALIDVGAVQTATDAGGRTPLDCAIQNQHEDTVELLRNAQP